MYEFVDFNSINSVMQERLLYKFIAVCLKSLHVGYIYVSGIGNEYFTKIAGTRNSSLNNSN